jgi:hypothetical protein
MWILDLLLQQYRKERELAGDTSPESLPAFIASAAVYLRRNPPASIGYDMMGLCVRLADQQQVLISPDAAAESRIGSLKYPAGAVPITSGS